MNKKLLLLIADVFPFYLEPSFEKKEMEKAFEVLTKTINEVKDVEATMIRNDFLSPKEYGLKKLGKKRVKDAIF